jgi:hypothetical protein
VTSPRIERLKFLHSGATLNNGLYIPMLILKLPKGLEIVRGQPFIVSPRMESSHQVLLEPPAAECLGARLANTRDSPGNLSPAQTEQTERNANMPSERPTKSP